MISQSKLLSTLFLSTCFLLSLNAESPQSRNYTLGGFSSIMPYALREATEAGTRLKGGLMHSLVEEIAKRTHYHFVYYFPPRSRMEGEMERGKLDFLPAVDPRWLSNPDDYVFTLPWFRDRSVFLTRTSRGLRVEGLDDLRGKRVGMVAGFVYPEFPDDAAFVRDDAATLARNIRRLEAGLLDAVYGSELEMKYWIKILKRDLAIQPFSPMEYDLRWACLPRLENQLKVIQKALTDMKREGIIDKILATYQ